MEGKNVVRVKEMWLGWIVELLEAERLNLLRSEPPEGLNPLSMRPAAARHLRCHSAAYSPTKTPVFHHITLSHCQQPRGTAHSWIKSSIFSERTHRRKALPSTPTAHNYNSQDTSRRGRDRASHWPTPRAAARRLVRGHVRPPPSESGRQWRSKSAGHGGWLRAMAGSAVRGCCGALRGAAGADGSGADPRLRAAIPGHPATVGTARGNGRFQYRREVGNEGNAAR